LANRTRRFSGAFTRRPRGPIPPGGAALAISKPLPEACSASCCCLNSGQSLRAFKSGMHAHKPTKVFRKRLRCRAPATATSKHGRRRVVGDCSGGNGVGTVHHLAEKLSGPGHTRRRGQRAFGPCCTSPPPCIWTRGISWKFFDNRQRDTAKRGRGRV